MSSHTSLADFARVNKTSIVARLGYALFLATNATVVWGGVFPFLPDAVQTPQFTSIFFVSQALAFALCFLVNTALSYLSPGRGASVRIRVPALCCLLGWACLFASMYVPGRLLALGCGAGALIGYGTAGFQIAWQYVFAAQRPEVSSRNFIFGTLLAPLIYFALYLLPIAITSFLIPLVFMPVYSLCIVLVGQSVHPDQAMLTDCPRTHPDASKQLVRDYWRSAVSIGALALSCGVARSLALGRASTALVVNNISMVALLLGAAAVLAVWNTRPLRISITMFFRLFFPFAITSFLLLPVFGDTGLTVTAGGMYALYACCGVLVMVQCGQAARDRAINPTFVFGVVAGIMYLLHDVGFLVGLSLEQLMPFGIDPYMTVSFATIYLLAMMFFMVQGGFQSALSPSRVQADHIELMLLGASHPRARASAGVSADAAGERVREGSPYLDRVSKQCQLLARKFKLSARELEVVEALARGDTIPGIASALGLSENTVRTHIKRIYGKIDVHKKQELLDLVRTFDPAALVDNNRHQGA